MTKYIKWDITSKCNLHCIHCSVGKNYSNNNVKDIPVEQKLEIIDKLAEGGVEGISLLGGEPLTMGNDFFSVIDRAISKGLKISVVTNGLLMSGDTMEKVARSGIDNLTISLDGGSKETHEYIRGKNTFEKLLFNIQNLTGYVKENKIPMEININTVINRLNYPEINKMIDLCIRLGVDRWTLLTLGKTGFAEDNFDSISLTPKEEINAAKIVIERYSSGNIGALEISPQFYPLVFDYVEKIYNLKMPKTPVCCTAAISLGYLTPDGNMYACDRIYHGKYVGRAIDGAMIHSMNLNDHAFYDIWNSDYYKKMFPFIYNENSYKNHTPCNHCIYLKNGYCKPCPLYSLDSGADIKICKIIEKELGDISGSDIETSPTLSSADIEPSLQIKEQENKQISDSIMENIPLKREGVRFLEREDILVLLNPYNEEFYNLDLFGKTVWDMIDGRNTALEIASEIENIAVDVQNILTPEGDTQELKLKVYNNVMLFFDEIYKAGFITWPVQDKPLDITNS